MVDRDDYDGNDAPSRATDIDWKKVAPRWFLVLALLNVSIVAFYYERQWRQRVDDHITHSSEGYGRLATAESAIIGVQGSVTEVKTEIQDARSEIRSMREDQLAFYSLQAQALGFPGKAADFKRRLKEIENLPPPASTPRSEGPQLRP